VPCTGYRNTETVRINDQTEFVRSKALTRNSVIDAKLRRAPLKLTHLPQDLQVQGRSLFFSHYVSDFSRTWNFLHAYQDPQATPEYLTLGIDAVSLAFLAHQVSSQTARDLGRRKYGAALKLFNKALQYPGTAHNLSTFQSALLFDLFEKIMKPEADIDASSYAHVQGAIALVKLRGVEQFREGAEMNALLGLASNATIYALSTGIPIPAAVRDIRRHAEQFVDTSDPKWKLGDIILEVTDTEAEMMFLRSTSSSFCAKSIELDRKLEEIALNSGPTWTYERILIAERDPRMIVSGNLLPFYDVYPNRMITQMWNVLRLIRILLCEQIVDGLLAAEDEDEDAGNEVKRARLAITSMTHEILASVAQMTNCDFAARHKLPKDSLPGRHTHTMSHTLDVYILIYALYVVAWSRNCPLVARNWTMKQLSHISEHFGIKEASIVVNILQDQETPRDSVIMDLPSCEKVRADPWLIYRLLGSYAFAAT
jgi:hypothetical protein